MQREGVSGLEGEDITEARQGEDECLKLMKSIGPFLGDF